MTWYLQAGLPALVSIDIYLHRIVTSKVAWGGAGRSSFATMDRTKCKHALEVAGYPQYDGSKDTP